MTELFSDRYKIKPEHPPEGYMYDRIPQKLRGELKIIFEFILKENSLTNYKDKIYIKLYEKCRKALKERPKLSPTLPDDLYQLLVDCTWYEYYDLCELYYQICTYKSWFSSKAAAAEFTEELNNRLEKAKVGYRMKNGRIEPIRASAIDKEVEKVRILLKEPEFEGPDEQFEKALGFLNKRPNPDSVNCIKDAVGAVEGVAKIVTGKHKDNLDDIAQDLVNRGIIPKQFHQIFVKVYACRGNLGGVAHGQVGKSEVSVEEAELILGICASMIIYLAKKFNKQVV